MALCFNDQLQSFAQAVLLPDGHYDCQGVGAYLLLSVDEVNAFALSPALWTAADGLAVGWSVLGIWLSVAAVMFIGKIVNWGADRDISES